ncbi:CHAT domain-containing protein [Chondrinema litorale]|uniref:CHAT domain-containing protein n=1 Tax=Chondrinema litorale TaxID=2994555 RepID=UPI0025433815|nr:CHAT domain-containing tetratricopeptide repeat protein [Chondrinema litorale]UZR95829.1 CHAT domain-containing protein [Chondrinema litorale]
MKYFLLSLLAICINYYALKANSVSDSLQIENSLEQAVELEKQRNLEGARAIYFELLDQAKKQELNDVYGKLLWSIGRNYFRNYKSDSAAYWLEKFQVENESLHFKDKKLVYSSFTYLGQTYSRLKKPFKNIDAFKKSIDYVKQNESLQNTPDVFLPRAYNNTGVAYQELGDFETALQYLDSALINLKEILDYPSELEAHIYSNKGNIYKKLGFTEEALEFTFMQVKIYEQLPEEQINYQDWGLVYWYIASCYQYSNASKEDLLNAIKYCEISENYFKQGGEKAPLLIYSYYIYAETYYNLGEYDKATFYIEKALEQNIERYGENFGELGYCYLLKSKIAEKTGKLDEAEQLMNKTIALYDTIDWKIYNDISEAYYIKGNLLVEHNINYNVAMTDYQQALQVLLPDFKPNSFLDNPTKDQLYNSAFLFNALQYKAKGLMQFYKHENKPEYIKAAMDCYTLAYRFVKLSREETISLRTKSSYIRNKFSLYEDGIAAAYEAYQQTQDKNYLLKAVYFADLSKSNNLLDKLEKIRQEERLDIPSALLEQERKALAAISFNEKKLYDLKKSSADSSEIAKTEKNLFNYKINHENIINSIQAQYPEYYHFSVNETTSFNTDDFLNQISDDQLFLSYFSGEKNLYVFALSKTEVNAQRLKPLSEFEPVVKNLINDIKSNTNKDFSSNSYKLFKYLVDPIFSSLKNLDEIKSISVIPDGITGYLPFELLIQQEANDNTSFKSLNYMLNDYTFSYHNSLSIFNFNKQRKSYKTALNFLGFAPEFKKESNPLIATRSAKDEAIAENLEVLPGALNEVNNIASIFGGETKTGQEATESNFKALAQNAEILHLATHTIIDDENPMYSKLVFSSENDPKEDGLLYTYELFNMHLKANLVCLSACNTGTGKYYKGEGVISLANGFMYAGIPNIMMTAWSVPDAATSELMENFYSELKNGKNKPEALREAKLQYLKNADENLAHPYYWGAYMMIGNSNDKGKNTNYLYWIIAGVMGVLLLLIALKKLKRGAE